MSAYSRKRKLYCTVASCRYIVYIIYNIYISIAVEEVEGRGLDDGNARLLEMFVWPPLSRLKCVSQVSLIDQHLLTCPGPGHGTGYLNIKFQLVIPS